MILFYCQHYNAKNAILIDEEAQHCVKVLRRSEGEVINITDGQGHLAKAEITKISKNKVNLDVIDSSFKPRRKNEIHIAIAPTKSRYRIEFFVEKAIEIGVEKILFFKSQRSEKPRVNLKRMEKIAISAMKQSLKTHLTKIEDIQSIKTILHRGDYDQKFIAHCMDPDQHLLKIYKSAPKTLILIGPEGDFTQAEVKEALNFGFEEISLGPSRLRTETAGIVAVNIFNLLQD